MTVPTNTIQTIARVGVREDLAQTARSNVGQMLNGLVGSALSEFVGSQNFANLLGIKPPAGSAPSTAPISASVPYSYPSAPAYPFFSQYA